MLVSIYDRKGVEGNRYIFGKYALNGEKMTNGSSKIKVDTDLYLKIHDCQFDTLLDALVIINETSKTIVDKMKEWKKLNIGGYIPEADIKILDKWVRDTPPSSPGGEPFKIARSLMWYIVKKHLGGNIGERFKEIKIEITFPP